MSLGQPYWVDTMKAGQNEDRKLACAREGKRERERENEPSMYFRTKRIGESKGVRPWQRGGDSQGLIRVVGG